MAGPNPVVPYLSFTEAPRIAHSTPYVAEDEERGRMVLLYSSLQPVVVL